MFDIAREHMQHARHIGYILYKDGFNWHIEVEECLSKMGLAIEFSEIDWSTFEYDVWDSLFEHWSVRHIQRNKFSC